MATARGLLDYRLANAVLAWATVGLLCYAGAVHVRSGAILWGGVAAAVVVLALVPPAVSRRPTEMVAWEVLAIGALPAVIRAFDRFVGPVTYLAVAALALVVAVELDAYTGVEMTPDFAVAFVVVVTMAVAGLWAIARYASDVYLGTTFLSGQTALMWDLVVATGLGVAAGLAFELFRRASPWYAIAREPWGTPR